MSYERFQECMRRRQPYFGDFLGSLQGLALRHAFMRQLVVTEIFLRGGGSAPLRILEIGSWAGGSAITWARALQEFNQGHGSVYCVDPWTPYEIDRQAMGAVMLNALEFDAICPLFWHNVFACGTGHLIRGIRAKSQDALSTDLGPFNIIYIDGAHNYTEVRRDIELSTPLLVEGGILCGDDLEQQLDQVDQNHMLAHCEEDWTTDPATEIGYHPGVTRAVGELLGKVENWEGFWAARRKGGQWMPAEILEFVEVKLAIPPHILEAAQFTKQPTSLDHVERSPP